MNLLENGQLDQFLESSEGAYVEPASRWQEETLKRIRGDEELIGETLPWSKTHSWFRMRPGEVTLWAGINGHGKSLILGQAVAWQLKRIKCLIASMEMRPESTMERMVYQVFGNRYPPEDRVRRFFRWTDNRLWIYNQLDTVASERILAMVRYAVHEGIQHIVIDSLMKCGVPRDDYEGQTGFVDRICNVAQSSGVHVTLVHHMRKGEKEEDIPGKFDVRGASEIVDMVDNLAIAHRNKKKERKKRAGEDYDPSEPDATLTIAKQRNATGEDGEGRINLWYHAPSQQFIPRPDAGAMPYKHD